MGHGFHIYLFVLRGKSWNLATQKKPTPLGLRNLPDAIDSIARQRLVKANEMLGWR
jgi:hypothetical protein